MSEARRVWIQCPRWRRCAYCISFLQQLRNFNSWAGNREPRGWAQCAVVAWRSGLEPVEDLDAVLAQWSRHHLASLMSSTIYQIKYQLVRPRGPCRAFNLAVAYAEDLVERGLATRKIRGPASGRFTLGERVTTWLNLHPGWWNTSEITRGLGCSRSGVRIGTGRALARGWIEWRLRESTPSFPQASHEFRAVVVLD